MTLLLALVLVAGAAAAAAASTRAPSTIVPVPTLPFESHSSNDLDAWPALLAVGVRFIKLDIGVCDADSCSAHSTFGRTDLPGYRGNSSDCFASGGATYCCLCLRGDASTRPTLFDPFNTTFDLVAWLASSPRSLPRPPAPPLYLGLDFGGSPGCGQLTSPPCDAGALVASWLLDMQAAIAAAGVAVVPYGDAGIGGLLLGLDAACLGGGGGGGGGCDTATQRALQALPYPVESGGPFPPLADDPARRIQVFNDDWTQFASKCAASDSFSGQDTNGRSATPFLWYEQQDQYEFANLFAEWRACPTRPANRTSNNTGLVAVSNVGPAMFEMFTSAFIGRGLSAQFTADSGPPPTPSAPAGLRSPLLAVAAAGAGAPAGVDRWAVLSVRNSTDGATLLYVLPVTDGHAPAPLASAPTLRLPVPAADRLIGLSLAKGTAGAPPPPTLLVAASASGTLVVLTLDADSGVASVASSTALPPGVLPPGAALLSLAAVCSGADAASCAAVLALGGAAYLNVSAVSLSAPAAPAPAASLCVQSAFAADAGAALTLEADEAAGAAAGAAVGLLVYAANVSDASPLLPGRAELFGAYVAAALTPGVGSGVTLSLERAGLAAGTRPARIGFGAAPHLSSAASAAAGAWSSPTALLLATNSDCDCGLLLNNANFARCQLGNPALDASPFYNLFQSVASLATYSLGRIADFRALVNAPHAASPWPIAHALGACHPAIAHGKLGAAAAALAGGLFAVRAAHPNGTRTPAGDELFGPPVSELAVLAVHDGHVADGLATLTLCGLPNKLDGLAWDAWRLPQEPLQ